MTQRRPNLVFIMSDDHAAHSISAYGSVINRTPNLDRIAEGGMRFDSCFCTNSICAPSRASILTGTYNHVNGVTTLDTKLDNRLDMFPQRLRDAGYQTALFGKWHLGHGPGPQPRRVRHVARPARSGVLPRPEDARPRTRRRRPAHGRPTHRLRDRSDHRRLHRLARSSATPIVRSRCCATTRRRIARGSPTRSTRPCTTTSTSPNRRRSGTTTRAAPTWSRRCTCTCSTCTR